MLNEFEEQMESYPSHEQRNKLFARLHEMLSGHAPEERSNAFKALGPEAGFVVKNFYWYEKSREKGATGTANKFLKSRIKNVLAITDLQNVQDFVEERDRQRRESQLSLLDDDGHMVAVSESAMRAKEDARRIEESLANEKTSLSDATLLTMM